MRSTVYMHAGAMDWAGSPSGSVYRKRFHLVGPAEAGQVTSLVRYEPGAAFPPHDHPDGEEIFVLRGTFSDQTGDFGEGSHLLNPEGFSHAPYSDEGCLIFVKLRQYSGIEHHTVNAGNVALDAEEGLARRLLNRQENESTYLAELAPGSEVAKIPTGGLEGFVVSGALTVNDESLTQFDWFRSAPGDKVRLSSQGCILYVKEGAVIGLHSL